MKGWWLISKLISGEARHISKTTQKITTANGLSSKELFQLSTYRILYPYIFLNRREEL